jgi:hypothetical protein
MKFLVIIASFFVLTAACSTEVDVGRNGRERDYGSSTGSPNAENTEPPTAAESTGSVGCYEAAEKLPPQLEDFCKSGLEEERLQFARAYDTLCRQKLFSHLLHPDCGWDGTRDINNYITVIEGTPLDAPSSESNYYHYVAYSLTTPASDAEYLDTILLAHSNPKEFAKRFKGPKALTITPGAAGLVAAKFGKKLNYSAEISAQVAGTTKVLTFDSEIHAYTLTSGLSVLSDHVVGNRSGINSRNHMSFSTRLSDGRGKIVVLEELELPQIYGPTLREIAARVLLNVDKDRMRIMYENAVIH